MRAPKPLPRYSAALNGCLAEALAWNPELRRDALELVQSVRWEIENGMSRESVQESIPEGYFTYLETKGSC